MRGKHRDPGERHMVSVSLTGLARPLPVCKLRPDNVAATFRGAHESGLYPRGHPLKLFVYVTCQINARLSRQAPLGRVQITGSSPTADIITIATTQVDEE